jgi:iron-sulfur cluster repair protein YtfE (RIC family)
MLPTTGRRSDSDELADMLLECNDRIRTAIALAMALGRRLNAPLEQVVDGCSRIERYVTQAMPLHVRDIEQSLLPRLRGRSPEIDGALEQMRAEHDLHSDLVRQLLEVCNSLREDPAQPRTLTALADAAQALEATLEPHLAAEETVIFPAVRALLSSDEQDEITRELHAARGGGG